VNPLGVLKGLLRLFQQGLTACEEAQQRLDGGLIVVKSIRHPDNLYV